MLKAPWVTAGTQALIRKLREEPRGSEASAENGVGGGGYCIFLGEALLGQKRAADEDREEDTVGAGPTESL